VTSQNLGNGAELERWLILFEKNDVRWTRLPVNGFNCVCTATDTPGGAVRANIACNQVSCAPAPWTFGPVLDAGGWPIPGPGTSHMSGDWSLYVGIVPNRRLASLPNFRNHPWDASEKELFSGRFKPSFMGLGSAGKLKKYFERVDEQLIRERDAQHRSSAKHVAEQERLAAKQREALKKTVGL
jgi:hypothetical protein